MPQRSREANISSSLYPVTAVPITSTSGDSEPDPDPPGTIHTASYETVDNDRAALMLNVGVVR